MKKKVFRYFALVLCAMGLSLSFASCGVFDRIFDTVTSMGNSTQQSIISSEEETSNVESVEPDETDFTTEIYEEGEYKFTLTPGRARIYVGDSFTVTCKLDTGESLTFNLYEIAGAGFVSINGKTVTAIKAGKTSILVREFSIEELSPVLIEVEILKRTE